MNGGVTRSRTLVGALMAAIVLAAVSVLSPSVAGAQAEVRLCDGVPVTITGTPGDDVIVGTDGPDVIAGLQGNDEIDGLGGDDIICAGIGDDYVLGGQGFDILFGAQGDDILFSSDDNARTDTRGARMFGGAGADTLVGSDRWDRMQGGAGDDILEGREGRDWLRGGAGLDIIDGGFGIDDLHGGNGDDFLILRGADTVRGGAGNDLCRQDDFSAQSATVSGCNIDEFVPFVPEATVTLSSCTNSSTGSRATGTITNNIDQQLNRIIVELYLDASDGFNIGRAETPLLTIAPGETITWEVVFDGDASLVASCRASHIGVLEDG